jgi:hypothetical protein
MWNYSGVNFDLYLRAIGSVVADPGLSQSKVPGSVVGFTIGLTSGFFGGVYGQCFPSGDQNSG